MGANPRAVSKRQYLGLELFRIDCDYDGTGLVVEWARYWAFGLSYFTNPRKGVQLVWFFVGV